PTLDISFLIAIRCVDGSHHAGTYSLVMDFAFVLNAHALQDLLNMRQNRVESLLSDDVNYRFADEVFGLASKHLRKRSAHELISQIGTTPCKHEWGFAYNCF